MRFDLSRLRPGLNATLALLLSGLLAACGPTSAQTAAPAQTPKAASGTPGIAVFAGGCFWCTESDFDKVPGVLSTTSGYMGGSAADATYERVSAGGTAHIEAVQVRFDPAKTDYARLLEAFWPTIDPLTPNRQFCDGGAQYRSAIFYSNDEEKRLAEASKQALQASGRFSQPLVTEILPATAFYPAEDYHQDYAIRNPLRYSYYRNGCGRDKRLEQVWGTPD